jgi:hypothetical protein
VQFFVRRGVIVVTEFCAEKYYLTGSKPSLLVREVDEIWTDEHSLVRADDGRRLVFVERYLGDRVEAWVSVVEFDEDKEVETMRWNAKLLQSISFKSDPMPESHL